MNSQPLEPVLDVHVDSIVVTPLVNDVAVPDFDATYVSEFGGLVRLAVLLVDDVNRAEEVVQDAFIKSHPHRQPPGISAQCRAERLPQRAAPSTSLASQRFTISNTIIVDGHPR
jgi:hypothetical protein